jgi:FHA domain
MPALYFAQVFEGVPNGVFELADNPQAEHARWKIGRGSDNDIVIKDKRISRRAIVITRAFVRGARGSFYDRYCIENVGNRNGVWVNGVSLKPYDPLPLEPQDKICLGWADARAIFLASAEDTINDAAWNNAAGWPHDDDFFDHAVRHSAGLNAGDPACAGEECSSEMSVGSGGSEGTVASKVSPVNFTPIAAPSLDNPWELIAWTLTALNKKLEPLPGWLKFLVLAAIGAIVAVILFEWVK